MVSSVINGSTSRDILEEIARPEELPPSQRTVEPPAGAVYRGNPMGSRCPHKEALVKVEASFPLSIMVLCLLVGAPLGCGPSPGQEAPATSGVAEEGTRFRVLVMSRTTGFRHSSIEPGVQAIRNLGAEHHFSVDATEDAADFSTGNLARYDVVAFLNTSESILDDAQKEAFERFIRSGKGFVGIHAAADTHYDWPWYGELVGAYFESHPEPQTATIHVIDREHPSTRHLPERWERFDEWYNFREPLDESTRILAVLDPDSYDGSEMGDLHPIAWYREFDGGRAWYTAGGHTEATYAEPLFLQHLLGGIEWAAGRAP
jgi:type 1 glutamine amidotransferase